MAMNPRLLRPLATGFNPKSISGLELWFDATDASTITTVSGAVSEWKSKAGGRTSTQTTANNRPAYQATGINGKPALEFNGTNNELITDFNASAISGYVTYAAAVLPAAGMTTTADYPGVIQARNSTANGLLINGPANPNRWTMMWRNTGFDATVGGEVLNARQIVLSTIDASTLTVRVNGAVGTLSGTYTAGSNESNAVYRMGRDGTLSRYFSGLMGEVLLFSRTLTTAELVSVERYLARKWGVTL
jgi:hypothetical protein